MAASYPFSDIDVILDDWFEIEFLDDVIVNEDVNRPTTSTSRPTMSEVTTSLAQTQRKEKVRITVTELQSIIDKLVTTNTGLIDNKNVIDVEKMNNLLHSSLLPIIQVSSKCLEACADTCWSKFHKQIPLICSELVQTLKLNRNFLLLLCVKFFQALIQSNIFQKEISTTTSKNVSSEEVDIVNYIGGSIISKLTKKYSINTKKNYISETLRSLSVGIETSSNSLTKMFDRGGLFHISQKASDFFLGLEICFRRIYPSSSMHLSFCQERYFNECMSNEIIKKDFMQAIDNSKQLPAENVAECFKQLIDSFFIVRAHHNCHRIMEQYTKECKSSKSKGKKSLRKDLKSKSTH